MERRRPHRITTAKYTKYTGSAGKTGNTAYRATAPGAAPTRMIRTAMHGLCIFLIICTMSATAAAERVPSPGAPGPVASASVYRKAAPAVVGIQCSVDGGRGGRRGRNDRHGTGMIIDPVGLVLTSTTVIPPGARNVRVYLSGGREVAADVLKTVPREKFCLLRLRSGGDYAAVELADSDRAHLGQPSFALGNAFRSILRDDQVTFAAGIVSGTYELHAPTEVSGVDASYSGPVLETTASVNDHMDGGPLLDSDGRVIGMLTSGYAPQRWLGTAIPINRLKPLFGKYRRWHSDRAGTAGPYLGLELVELGGGDEAHRRLQVTRAFAVGPAWRAGLRSGDVIVSLDGQAVRSVDRFRKLLERLPLGGSARIGLGDRRASGATAARTVDARSAIETDPAETATRRREVTIRAWARF